MCHNNLWFGNVLINSEGEMDPAELVFDNYDDAGYGYRAFDLIYNMLDWPIWKIGDEATRTAWINSFVGDYVDERKKLGDAGITTQQIDAGLGNFFTEHFFHISFTDSRPKKYLFLFSSKKKQIRKFQKMSKLCLALD